MVATKRAPVQTVPLPPGQVGPPAPTLRRPPQPKEANSTGSRAPPTGTGVAPDFVNILQRQRLEAGLPELTDQEILDELLRRQALGDDVADEIAAFRSKIAGTETKQGGEIAEEAEELDLRGTPEQVIDPRIEPTVEFEEEGFAGLINKYTPTGIYLRKLAKVPGFKEGFKAIANSRGISKEDLTQLQQLNPERADEIRQIMMTEAMDRQSRTLLQNGVDLIGVLTEAIPPAAAVVSIAGVESPFDKIEDQGGFVSAVDQTTSAARALSVTDPERAAKKLSDAEEKLNEIEGRIILLAGESAIVRQNPDKLDTLLTEIDNSYIEISEARNEIFDQIILNKQGVLTDEQQQQERIKKFDKMIELNK